MQQNILSEKIKTLGDFKIFSNLSIDEKNLRQLLLLEEILPNKFKALCLNMKNNHGTLWKEFIACKDPYKFMSLNEHKKLFDFAGLTKFQKLILIKLLRPDALITSVNYFISEILGSKFLNNGVPSINDLYAQSLPTTPIIFILSPGSDPTNQLIRFAKELRGSSLHMDIVSLGQGQGPRAEELINKSLILKGRWIFLQNCHLAASFMPRLQQLVAK